MRNRRHKGWLFCPTGVWEPGTIRVTVEPLSGNRGLEDSAGRPSPGNRSRRDWGSNVGCDTIRSVGPVAPCLPRYDDQRIDEWTAAEASRTQRYAEMHLGSLRPGMGFTP